MKQIISTCLLKNHGAKAIIGFCLNDTCNLNRFCCQQCVQEKHSDHSDDCQTFQNIQKIIDQQINDQRMVNKGIVELKKNLENYMNCLTKETIREVQKFQSMNQFLEKDKLDEFSDHLEQVKQCYNENKKNMKNSTQKFMDILKEIKMTGFKIIQELNKVKESRQVDLLIQFGLALYDLGKYNESLEWFDSAIEQNPYNAQTFYYKGHTLYKLEKLNETIQCYDQSIELDPYDEKIYSVKGIGCVFSQGSILVELKKPNEAIQCYDKCIELNPNDALIYYNKGLSLLDLQKYNEANQCFDKSLELDPNNAETYLQKAQGFGLFESKQFNEAIKWYDYIIELDPNFYNAYEYKGMALEELQQYDKAIECFELAIQKGGNKEELLQQIQSIQ